MTSFQKTVAILDVFTAEKPVVAQEDVAELFGYTRATAYRYLKALCEVGLLARFGGSYILGPRAIELDFTIRQSDPLLHAGEAVMAELREQYGCDLQLLSIFEDRILAIGHVAGRDPLASKFPRGRVMPLFHGAGAKAILSALPTRRLRRLYDRHHSEAVAAGLGESFDEFQTAVRAVRKTGYALSIGDVDERLVGLAAPIPDEGSGLPSCLLMIMTRQRYALVDQQKASLVVVAAARRIAAALSEELRNAVSVAQQQLTGAIPQKTGRSDGRGGEKAVAETPKWASGRPVRRGK